MYFDSTYFQIPKSISACGISRVHFSSIQVRCRKRKYKEENRGKKKKIIINKLRGGAKGVERERKKEKNKGVAYL